MNTQHDYSESLNNSNSDGKQTPSTASKIFNECVFWLNWTLMIYCTIGMIKLLFAGGELKYDQATYYIALFTAAIAMMIHDELKKHFYVVIGENPIKND